MKESIVRLAPVVNFWGCYLLWKNYIGLEAGEGWRRLGADIDESVSDSRQGYKN